MRRALAFALLGGLVTLAVLAVISDPAWDWRAIAGAAGRWTLLALAVGALVIFLSLAALGWAYAVRVLGQSIADGRRLTEAWRRRAEERRLRALEERS